MPGRAFLKLVSFDKLSGCPVLDTGASGALLSRMALKPPSPLIWFDMANHERGRALNSDKIVVKQDAK